MADTGMAGQTVAMAAVLAAGTFLLYFLKQVLDAVRGWHDEQRRADRLICALYAEIEANVHDLRAFLDSSAAWERAVADGAGLAAGKPGRIGHNMVYETHLAELASLPRTVIYKVVSFYTHQERLAAALERLDSLIRAGADSEERAAAAKRARTIAQEGMSFGNDVLHGLEVNAPLDLVKSALRARPGRLQPEAA